MSRLVNRMRAVHPGEVLREEYLAPLSLSVNALALALGVPATRIHEIVKKRRGVTADTAERLARYFGGDAASRLALQSDFDLKTLPPVPTSHAKFYRGRPFRHSFQRLRLAQHVLRKGSLRGAHFGPNKPELCRLDGGHVLLT